MEYRDELKLVVKAEVDKAIRDLNSYNKSTKKAETTTEAFAKAAQFVKRTLATAGLGLSVAYISSQLNQFAKSASEAEETASKFGVVFGDIAGKAEEVARKYASSFDVAMSTSKKLLGNVGDLLTGMGATQEQALELSDAVTAFGSDLASFSNYHGGAAGAVDALTKMMLGEREMVKSLGIVIREADVQQRLLEKGQEDLTGQAKLLATAQASLELAMEQSKNAIGDYERTANSTANTNRRLDEALKESKEIIGNYINEGLTPIKSGLADIIESYNEAALAKQTFENALETGEGASDYVDDAKKQMDEHLANREAILERYQNEGWAKSYSARFEADPELKSAQEEEYWTLQEHISESLSYQNALEEKQLIKLDQKNEKIQRGISSFMMIGLKAEKAILGSRSLEEFSDTPFNLTSDLFT